MKNFLRRLKIYGFGFGIGLLFVFFFFRNRGCTWLPENRVKNTVLGRVIVIQEDQEDLLIANGIDAKEAVSFLNDGDIRFGHSKKSGNPQVYSVVKEIKGREVELWFTLPKNSYISEIQWPKGSIQSARNSQDGMGKMVHFPNVENFVYLDENKIFTCQLKHVGLPGEKAVQKRLKASGKLAFDKSTLDTGSDPNKKAVEHVVFTNGKGLEIEADTKWLEEHIQFSFFQLADSVNCNAN